jgi:hypothetical protein
MPTRIKWVPAVLPAVLLCGPAFAEDPYPMGALAFFDAQSCPAGWQTATDAAGFFLVPFAPPIPPQQIGATVNNPLSSGEDRTHTHTFSSSISLTNMSYAGVAGCVSWLGLCDKQTSASGTMTFSGTTGASSSGVPYQQLLLCRKTEFTRNTNPPAGIPQYLVTFFSTASCPTGWKQTLTTSGRFIVGLPAGGAPQSTFGGTPLSVGEDRTHTHAFSGSVTVNNALVELDSGGQADGYGKQGTYSFSGTTAAASTGLPYMMVTQCQTCLPGDDDPACQGQ